MNGAWARTSTLMTQTPILLTWTWSQTYTPVICTQDVETTSHRVLCLHRFNLQIKKEQHKMSNFNMYGSSLNVPECSSGGIFEFDSSLTVMTRDVDLSNGDTNSSPSHLMVTWTRSLVTWTWTWTPGTWHWFGLETCLFMPSRFNVLYNVFTWAF